MGFRKGTIFLFEEVGVEGDRTTFRLNPETGEVIIDQLGFGKPENVILTTPQVKFLYEALVARETGLIKED